MTFKFIQFIHNYTILDYFHAQKVLKQLRSCSEDDTSFIPLQTYKVLKPCNLPYNFCICFIPLQTYKVSANKDSSDIVCPHCAAKKDFS